MQFDQQSMISPAELLALGIFVLPWVAAFVIDKRLARTRKLSGLPPLKWTAKRLLVCGYAALFAAGILFVVIPDLRNFKLQEKINMANAYARVVYNCIPDDYAGDAENICIGRFSDTGTPLADALHERSNLQEDCYYAVVCGDGAVLYTLFSGNPITQDDLHEWTQDMQWTQAKRFGTDYRDVTGYYAAPEK